jgi:hypothetical protein
MDADLFKRMQEAAARFNSGESDFEEIMTPVGPAHLVRDASDPRGFRLDFVAEGSKHTVSIQEYPPAETRPHGYPAPLPFLAGCKSIVDTLDQSVSFVDPDDPEEAFERLMVEMQADGWTLVGWEGGQVLEKEETRRTLSLSGELGVPRIVLREERITAPEPEE